MPATYSKRVSSVVSYSQSSYSVTSTSTSTPAIGEFRSHFRSITASPIEFGLENGSPHWISGGDVVFKTPKSPSPAKTRRRTEMTPSRSKAGKRISAAAEFKIPSLMFGSPPGVKTRARRSSMYVSKQKVVQGGSSGPNKASTSKQVTVKRVGKSVTGKKQTKLTAEKVLKSDVAVPIVSETRHGKRGSKLESAKSRSAKLEKTNTSKSPREQSPTKKKGIKTPTKVVQGNDSPNLKQSGNKKVGRNTRQKAISPQISKTRSLTPRKSTPKKATDLNVSRKSSSQKKKMSTSRQIMSAKKKSTRSTDQTISFEGEALDDMDASIIAAASEKSRSTKSAQSSKSQKGKKAQSGRTSRNAKLVRQKRVSGSQEKSPFPTRKASETKQKVASPVQQLADKVTPRRVGNKRKRSAQAVKESPAVKSKSTPGKALRNRGPASLLSPPSAGKATPQKSQKKKISPPRSVTRTKQYLSSSTPKSAVKRSKTPKRSAKSSPEKIQALSFEDDDEMNEPDEDYMTPPKVAKVSRGKSSTKKQKATPKQSAQKGSMRSRAHPQENALSLKMAREKSTTPSRLTQSKSELKRKSEVRISDISIQKTSDVTQQRAQRKSRSPALKKGSNVSQVKKGKSPSPAKKTVSKQLGSPRQLREQKKTLAVNVSVDEKHLEMPTKRRITNETPASPPTKKLRKISTPSKTPQSSQRRKRKSLSISGKKSSGKKQRSFQQRTSPTVNSAKDKKKETAPHDEKPGISTPRRTRTPISKSGKKISLSTSGKQKRSSSQRISLSVKSAKDKARKLTLASTESVKINTPKSSKSNKRKTVSSSGKKSSSVTQVKQQRSSRQRTSPIVLLAGKETAKTTSQIEETSVSIPSKTRASESPKSSKKKSSSTSGRKSASATSVSKQRSSRQRTSPAFISVQDSTVKIIAQDKESSAVLTPKIGQIKSARKTMKASPRRLMPLMKATLTPKTKATKVSPKVSPRIKQVNVSSTSSISGRFSLPGSSTAQSTLLTDSPRLTPRANLTQNKRRVEERPSRSPRKQKEDEHAEIDKVISAMFQSPQRSNRDQVLIASKGTPTVVLSRASPTATTSSIQAREDVRTVTSVQRMNVSSPSRLITSRYDTGSRIIPSTSRMIQEESAVSIGSRYTEQNLLSPSTISSLRQEPAPIKEVTRARGTLADDFFNNRKLRTAPSPTRNVLSTSQSQIAQTSYTRRSRNSPSPARLSTQRMDISAVNKDAKLKLDTAEKRFASPGIQQHVTSEIRSARAVRESYTYTGSGDKKFDMSTRLTSPSQHRYYLEERNVRKEEDEDSDSESKDHVESVEENDSESENHTEMSEEEQVEAKDHVDSFEEEDESYDNDVSFGHTVHSQRCTIQ